MGTYLGLVAGHREQHLGHSVAYVVPDHISDKEQRDEHSDAGKHQEAPAFAGHSCASAYQEMAYLLDGAVKNDSGAPGEYADYETEQQEPAVF